MKYAKRFQISVHEKRTIEPPVVETDYSYIIDSFIQSKSFVLAFCKNGFKSNIISFLCFIIKNSRQETLIRSIRNRKIPWCKHMYESEEEEECISVTRRKFPWILNCCN